MISRATRRRAAGRWRAVLPVPGRHGGVGHHMRLRPLSATRPAIRSMPGPWWRRLTDDQDFIGAKLLVLAALLVLTAVLEGAV